MITVSNVVRVGRSTKYHEDATLQKLTWLGEVGGTAKEDLSK